MIVYPWAGEVRRESPSCTLPDLLRAYARVHARWVRTLDAMRKAEQC